MTFSLEELIGRYESMAIHYVAGRISESEAARDIVQTVVGKLLELERSFESQAHLRNYFFSCLRNAAADFERSGDRKQIAATELLSTLSSEAGDPARGLEVEEELAAQRRRLGELQGAMGSLSETEREILRQRFWEKRTFRDISEAKGVAISTLKSREESALKKLRNTIGKPLRSP